MSSGLVVPARASRPLLPCKTVPGQSCASAPAPNLSPSLKVSSRLSLSLFQSEPQAQGCTARRHQLGPGLVRPETIGGHEAVCKAPAKPVC